MSTKSSHSKKKKPEHLQMSPSSRGIMTPCESAYTPSESTTTADEDIFHVPASTRKLGPYDDIFLHLRHLEFDWQREIIPLKDICNDDGTPSWELFEAWLPPSEKKVTDIWGDYTLFRLPFNSTQDVLILKNLIMITSQIQLQSTFRYLLSREEDLRDIVGYVCPRAALTQYWTVDGCKDLFAKKKWKI